MADKACSAKSREKMFSNWSFAFQKKTWIVKTFIQKPISNKYENYHVCSELGGEIAWESLSICSKLSKTKLIGRFEFSIQLINSSTFLSLASRDLSLKRKTKVETLTILPHSPSSPWGKGKQTFSLQLSFFSHFFRYWQKSSAVKILRKMRIYGKGKEYFQRFPLTFGQRHIKKSNVELFFTKNNIIEYAH